MEPSASTKEIPIGPVVSSETQPSVSTGEESVTSMRRFPFTKKTILVVVALVSLVALGSIYLVAQNKAQPKETESTQSSTEWTTYQNPNGFSITYPKTTNLEANEKGFVLNGDVSMAFLVGDAKDQSLLEVVSAIAKNFGINAEDGTLETVSVDSRTGYILEYNNARYYYFPLMDDLYLELEDKKQENELDQEILAKLKFTPPQTNL